jgi:hypothetical protein
LEAVQWAHIIPFLVLVGCVGAQRRGPDLPPRADAAALQPGDLLVGLEGSARDGHPVLRVRVEGEQRVTAQVLLSLDAPAQALRGSADGAWLAVSAGDPERVALFRLDASAGDEPVWTSPIGCTAPVFGDDSRVLTLGCSARGRQPASLLALRLPSLTALSLVGEWGRSAPAVSRAGDLTWIEPADRGWSVVRRSDDGVPFLTHELGDEPRALWPQDDGSVLAEVAVLGGRREFRRLLPSGVVRNEGLPSRGSREVDDGTPVHATATGGWLYARCERGPCALVHVRRDGRATAPLNLGGPPTALSQVSAPAPRAPDEDLATAPASVLADHNSAEVGVLGVQLGLALESAFSTLDRAGFHPYWMEPPAGRDRPAGIGVGWAAGGHCIEYHADERGLIGAIDLQGCASPYVSPRLRPLLDGAALAEGGVGLARTFLGPGVAATVGDGDRGGGSASIRRSAVTYEAPERGYVYEATSEVLGTRRGRLLEGRVRLRLQPPTRRQAVAAP